MTNIFGTKGRAIDFFTQLEYREGQRETIEQIEDAFNQGKKTVILEAPTGSGKSRIAESFARQANDTHILTPQKILQDQYERDLVGEEIKIMKGRGAYPCLRLKGTCNEGMCKRKIEVDSEGKQIQEKCINCPYSLALQKAKESSITIHNFDSFYYQNFTGGFDTRKLLIIDECHNIENKYLDFISLKFSDKRYLEGLSIPNYKTLEEYVLFLEELNGYLEVRGGTLEEKKHEGLNNEEVKELDFCRSSINKLGIFFDSRNDGYEWVHEFKDKDYYKTIEFKPLFIQPFVKRTLFPKGHYILMMSATICDSKIFTQSIGLENQNEIEFIREGSHFPLENHSIEKRNIGFMSRKYIEDNLPKLVSRIEEILIIHSGQKGIIQTHTERIANYIKEHLNNSRLTFNKDSETPREMLKKHENKDSSVIVASGLREGIDLPGKLSEFQIICKTPYPDLGDKRVERKSKIEPKWYQWMTSMAFIQSLGRSVRSREDEVATYILDSCFCYFYLQNKKFFPFHLQKIISNSFFKNNHAKIIAKSKIKEKNIFELAQIKKGVPNE